jgi:peptidyl-tRNA hydrolase
VRIGVGHPGVKDAVQYTCFTISRKEERAWLDPLIDAIAANAPLLTGGKLRHHSRTRFTSPSTPPPNAPTRMEATE